MIAALAAVLVAATAAAVATPAAAAPAKKTGPDSVWVTLITGDRVALSTSGDVAAVVPGPGRDGIAVSSTTVNGHQHVVPVDAGQLINAGKLDPRLFDVTELAKEKHFSTTPLVVAPKPGAQRSARAMASSSGLALTRELPATGLVAMTATDPAAAWKTLSTTSSPAGKVWLDATYHATLDRSVPQIGAPEAWKAGWTGKGVKVAVLDSGVDETHPDLAGQEIASKNFTSDGTADVVGHGTHVASTIAGTGAKSGGKYRGVAPGASILDGKVLGDTGGGAISWILQGMEWAVAQGADIVNMSLGGPDDEGIDPVEEAINRLSATGTLFVVAAGNDGPRTETVGSPASAESALAVGAVGRDDSIASFSSRGPRIGDHGLKPDLTAPGVGIVAARSSTSALPDPDGDGYVGLSGTSMATPHVAGAAAILAQEHPDWSGQRLKATLMASAKPNPAFGVFDQGAGRVDVAAAIGQTLTTQPASVNIGTQLWPHDDDKPISSRITYTNTGTEPVTFELSATATGPGGVPSPAGMFTVAPGTLTVPAGGTADAVLTSDTRVNTPDGDYIGVVAAKSAGRELKTNFTVYREVESYDVTVKHLDGAGNPAANYSDSLANVQTVKFYNPVPDGAVSRIRLPKGEYVLSATLNGDDGFRIVTNPRVEVTGAGEFVLDGRVARPIKITGPVPSLKSNGTGIRIVRSAGKNQIGLNLTLLGGSPTPPSIGQMGPALPAADLRYEVRQSDIVPGSDPVQSYKYVVQGTGLIPAGITRKFGARELAEVRRTVGAVRGGHTAMLGASAVTDGFSMMASTPLGASGVLVDHVTEGTWRTGFWEFDAEGYSAAAIMSPNRSYRAGKRYEEKVNQAIFAPTGPQAERSGDTLGIFTPLWADSQGGQGISAYDTASSVLYQGTQKLGESTEPGDASFTVPAGRSNLRLEVRGERGSVADLSTSVTAVWNFGTDHVAEDTYATVPLMSVGFDAPLNSANAARAGTVFRIPLNVAGPNGNRTKDLRVQVSFNDGATWQPVWVLGNSALVNHPAAEGFVSLKVFAADRAGNSVEETIIRAYRITK